MIIYEKNENKKQLIIWGGTGNFKVLCELLKNEYNIIGFFDKNKDIISEYMGIPYLGDWKNFENWRIYNCKNNKIYFIISIGPGYGRDRLLLQNKLIKYGLIPIIAIHRTSFVADNTIIKEGTQIYANSVICVNNQIGKACIINTSSSVDHECIIEDGVAIGPGSHLAGLIHVEKFADIYTGAIILPRIRIGEGAIVGAGAVVLKDVEPYTIVVGNPARYLKDRH
jgi:sugar O-acyltransferase (sialic acid O-acetyltransferase NeuD family)